MMPITRSLVYFVILVICVVTLLPGFDLVFLPPLLSASLTLASVCLSCCLAMDTLGLWGRS